MAWPSYWQPDWFLTGWFPEVWFAPADESGIPEDELRPEYRGGGGRQTRQSDDARTKLFREHHDYLDGLRENHAQIDGRTIAIRDDMVVPDAIVPRAMRGTVHPTRVVDVLGDQLILAALALLIDEADD